MLLAGLAPLAAQEGRSSFDFEADVNGFVAVRIDKSAVAADEKSEIGLSRDAGFFKQGVSALTYHYDVQPQSIRGLYAPAKVPAGARGFHAWVRNDRASQLMFSLRENDGSAYQLMCCVPANEWQEITANFADFEPDENSLDDNGKLDLDQVGSIGVSDFAVLLANAPAGVGPAIPDLLGRRRLWLDDVRFPVVAEPLSHGLAEVSGKKLAILDNFDSGLLRWTPVKMILGAQGPSFSILPPGSKLEAIAAAAGPGMARTPDEAGGKGLRYTYTRGAQEIWGVHRKLNGLPLSGMSRFRLATNCSKPSFLVLQLKEKDGSSYQFAVQPGESTGWQTRSINLATDPKLEGDSKDENGHLDAAQIVEITVFDASGLAKLELGPAGFELDALVFE